MQFSLTPPSPTSVRHFSPSCHFFPSRLFIRNATAIHSSRSKVNRYAPHNFYELISKFPGYRYLIRSISGWKKKGGEDG